MQTWKEIPTFQGTSGIVVILTSES